MKYKNKDIHNMPIAKQKIEKILEEKNFSHYKICKFLDYSEGAFSMMLNGKRPFSDIFKEKILPLLEISSEEFESWVVADKYSKEILELALKAKKEYLQDKGLILTAKIDKILQSRSISRTVLSKQIKHSQSSVNNAITGKESLSKKLMQKISLALDIPENEIQSWVAADKHSLDILELAIKVQ